MNRDIVFMGCRGYTRNYGGWETFVKNLIDNWQDKETRFFVMELTHDINEKKIEVVNGVTCIRVFIKQTSQIAMLLMDLKTLFMLGNIARRYNMKNPIVYVMGARVGITFWFMKHYIHKSNYSILHNPAGLEWKRKKFNALIRLHSRIAHFFFNRTVDYIVCDSQGILDVYKSMVPLSDSHMRFIAYGTYPANELALNIPQKVEKYFVDKKIRPYEYYMILGRMVPENNYELIIREFMESETEKDLVVICNNNKESKFYQALEEKLHFSKDQRIKFVGTMYDREILNYVRQMAHAYIHGHSVGGTNPGLLEALSTTEVCILYDVIFNRQVALDNALYFDERHHLKDVMVVSELLSSEERRRIGEGAKNRMRAEYSWDRIVEQYSDYFNYILEIKD